LRRSSAQVLERKSADGVTLNTRGGEMIIYGNLDMSLDSTNKGISNMSTSVNGPPNNTPFGNGGSMSAISTNLSYIGVRGFQSVDDGSLRFVYQLETQIDISSTSGTTNTNSNTSDQVKGGLTSRNSYIGLASREWGAVKIGKTDAPYKTSTARMNPFSGMLGDYSVVMGNSGGDNRVEFGTRLDHSIWFESGVWNGISVNVLVAPGQNRATDSSNVAAGESDCAGGNIPGSGGLAVACNDGSYGHAASTNLAYQNGPLYITGAYEIHKNVNRTSDIAAAFNALDVADEAARKIGLQYAFPSHTTVSVIFEKMTRNVDSSLTFQNERQRSGSWLALSQDLSAADSLHFGWAHANHTPGDPGQHNTPGGAGPDNTANMFTLAWKHKMDKNLSLYADWAETLNHTDAHYDLGAGGRGVTTDCHDASNPIDVNTASQVAPGATFDPAANGPRCWAGGHITGVSVGIKYLF
jgi:predicted porin